ncbi:regulatory protein weta [Aspergillus cavernicola]|uniref:Developmental regulatory protein wetA n=1 Tax=Aspergillus cavernicola TaxID=176166 RepID=A0ABR4J595_9EURO
MFAQPFDHSFNDLFNQYVNMDTSSTDDNKDVSFPCDFEQMFALDSLSNDCGDQSTAISDTQNTRQPVQHWGKDTWYLSQNTDCSTDQDNLAYQDSIQPPAILDFNVDIEFPSTGYPQASEIRSTPSTPPTTPGCKAKGGLSTPKSIRRHRDSNDRRGTLRKQSFSPGLMRSSQALRNTCRMAYPEAWAQRLQNFPIRNSDRGLPLSPPPSDILVQQENITNKHTPAQISHSAEGFRGSTEMPQRFEPRYFTHSPAIAMPSSSTTTLASQPQRYLNRPNTSALTPSPPLRDDFFPSPHSSDPQSMSSWNSDSLGTQAFQFTPELQGHDAQAWWSPMPSGVPQRQASYQQMIASPAPQRPIQVSADHGDLLQGGLMIQLDPTSFDISSSFSSATIPPTSNTQDNQSYNHGAPAPQRYVDSSSFTTPNIPNTSPSPSPSPKTHVSPKNGSILRNGMVMKSNPRRPHGRKLSGQSTPKPLKGPNSLSTSPRGSNKSVTVSFVNFGPQDSKKILTGVAPSGSSKTKARREQEARDRRRKLSEAALNAVRNAGGDVEALEAVFC